jgi:O-antigen/teichoic acid export membrane protein
MHERLNSYLVNKRKSVLQEGFFVAFGQVSGPLGAMLLVMVITSKLTPSQYGGLALALTFCSLVNQVMAGGLIAATHRFFSIAATRNELWYYFLIIKKYFVKVCVTTLFVSISCYFLFDSIVVDNLWLFIISVFAYSVFSTINAILNGFQNAARERTLVAGHLILDTFLRITLALVLLEFFDQTALTVLLVYSLSSMLTALSQFVFFKRKWLNPSYTSDIDVIKYEWWQDKIWSFAWPFSFWGVFTWIHLASDRWFLEVFTSRESVGLYSVLYQLGFYPISLMSGMIMTLFSPIVFQYAGDMSEVNGVYRSRQIVSYIAVASVVLTSLLFIFTDMFHRELFLLIVGEQYQGGSYLLSLVVAAGGAYATGQTLLLNPLTTMDSKFLLKLKISSSLIGVLCNFIGVYYYGVQGLVFGLAAFSIVFLMLVVLIKPKSI